MQKTTNYNLNQWEATDRVTRADFNADNAAIDAAIKSVADAASGGVKVVCGSYTGTGTFGEENPTTLTFDRKPLLVFIGNGNRLATLIRNATWTIMFYNSSMQTSTMSWSGNSVSWFSTTSSSCQMNVTGVVHYYVAILEA